MQTYVSFQKPLVMVKFQLSFSVTRGVVVYGPPKDAIHCGTVCQQIYQVSHLDFGIALSD